jgi:hypothetical protein
MNGEVRSVHKILLENIKKEAVWNYFFFWVGWDSPLDKSQPRMIDDESGAVGGMRTGRGNRNARRKPTLVPLCTSQIVHDLTCARTRAATMDLKTLDVNGTISLTWNEVRSHGVEWIQLACNKLQVVRTRQFLIMRDLRFPEQNYARLCMYQSTRRRISEVRNLYFFTS